MDAPEARTAAGRARQAEAGLVLLTVIWAVNFSVIKAGLGELRPYAFNALRFPVASLVLVGTLLRRGGPLMPRRSDLPRIVALGLLGNVAYQLFFINGINATRAGNASVLLATTPVLTALLSSRLGHERLAPRVWVGVFSTVAGILLVVGSAATIRVEGATLTGDLLMLGASACWSMYTVGAKDLIGTYGPLRVTAWTLWTGAVVLALIGLPELARLDWTAVHVATWGAVAYAGVLGIGVAYMLWYYGVRHIGNTRTATFANVVPVLALAVAWLWLHETPTFLQLLGAGIIIAGVSLARHRA